MNDLAPYRELYISEIVECQYPRKACPESRSIFPPGYPYNHEVPQNDTSKKKLNTYQPHSE